MSIVFMGRGEEAGVLVGDGVAYVPETGCVAQRVTKLHLFPELHCVMGFTGIGRTGRLFSLAIEGRYRDFDDMLTRVVADLRLLHMGMTQDRTLFPTDDDKKMSVGILGWSASRQRCEGYRVLSYEKEAFASGESVGLSPAWELLPIDYVWSSAMPFSSEDNPIRIAPEECADLIELGVRFVCAARASSGEDPDEPGNRICVGGFIHVVALDASGMRTWIAHDWPEDVVGERIDPTRGELIPAWLEGYGRENVA